MSDTCDAVKIEYPGNGSQTQFNFTFEYLKESEVHVEVRNETTNNWESTTDWTFSTPTQIQFNTAPAAPDTGYQYNIRIKRVTSIDPMIATFNPGSAIRARDLNDNFEQLQYAIQENKCGVADPINASHGITKPQQESGDWVASNDDKVASSDAIMARHDVYVQDTLPPADIVEQPGKGWQNTDKNWTSYWNPSANAWVAYVNTGPKGDVGPAPGLQDPSTIVSTIPNTIDGEAGQATANVTMDLEGDLQFTFGIPQGAKGETGSPADFGGTIDITAAPPDPLPNPGTFYLVKEPGGVANAGFGNLAGDTIAGSAILAYTGDAGDPWVLPDTTGSTGSKVIVSDTPPIVTDLLEGTLWWNSSSDDLTLYVLYDDQDPDGGLKWIEATPSSGGGIGDLQAVTDVGNVTTNGATFGGNVTIGTNPINGRELVVSKSGAAGIEFNVESALGGTDINSYDRQAGGYTRVAFGAETIEFNPVGDGNNRGVKIDVSGNMTLGGHTSPKINLDQNGSATFAGTVATGVTGTGVTLYNDGTIQSWNNGNLNTSIGSNGSATFGGAAIDNDEVVKISRGTKGSPSNNIRFCVDNTEALKINGDNIVLKYDGSATFDNTVTGGNKAPSAGTGFGVIGYSNTTADGTGSVVARNYGAGSNFVGIDAAGAKTADITAAGAATFASNTTVGGFDLSNANSSGARITASGALQLQRDSAALNSARFQIIRGTNDETVTINSDGSAFFGSNGVISLYGNDGQLVIKCAPATSSGFAVKNSSGTDVCVVEQSGDATFAGTVTGDNPDLTFFGKPTLNAGGTVFRSSVQKAGSSTDYHFYGTSTSGGGQSIQLRTDGTINAANVAFSVGTPDEIDVRDRLIKTRTALQAIKTAALNNNTDLAGLKAAIVSALADI